MIEEAPTRSPEEHYSHDEYTSKATISLQTLIKLNAKRNINMMNTTPGFKALLPIVVLSNIVVLTSCSEPDSPPADNLEAQVEDYIKKFPHQDTHNYAMRYTEGDPTRFNVWVLGTEPTLVKAGEDKVVRMNNDTFYKMAFVILDDGPVVLKSSAPSRERFNSFQLMDDRNANYRNVIYPDGEYTLFRGDKPSEIHGKTIRVPSSLSVVIVRVEVKDKDNAEDVAAAEAIFRGITIEGPVVSNVPHLDLLSGFDKDVEDEAIRRLDEAFASLAFTETVLGPGQEPGKHVPYFSHAAGTKGGWGGPVPSHSAYEMIFTDNVGETLDAAKGIYTITTDEPQVDAFWSITVYDTERGGFLHPNEDDRYHINNTGAVKNEDGTITFTFSQSCGKSDLNCLEVPAGTFDLAARYYLPHEEIISGAWTLPRPELQ
ncbi:DUF1214 domain-containing protein [Bacteroidota bacterium]